MPPVEFQKRPSEPIPTPVDDRGLVDVDQLIRAVKATVKPEYIWPKPRSIHHFYWPDAAYPYEGRGDTNPHAFRNLAVHKGLLPRVFENWLHEVTVPPPVPDREVMQYRIEAWQVALNLFRSAREVIQWERRARRRPLALDCPEFLNPTEEDRIGTAVTARIIAKHFRGFDRHISSLESLPPEFRLIEPTDSPQEVAATLGRVIMPRSIQLVDIVRPANSFRAAA
jgi:hypothetical protein